MMIKINMNLETYVIMIVLQFPKNLKKKNIFVKLFVMKKILL